MFQHEKQLFHPVAVEGPNPQYAALLQEQLGGANGELKAAMQYLSQSFRISDAQIKDLFLECITSLVESDSYENVEARALAREKISKFVLKETGKRPMVLPSIIEINGKRLAERGKKEEDDND